MKPIKISKSSSECRKFNFCWQGKTVNTIWFVISFRLHGECKKSHQARLWLVIEWTMWSIWQLWLCTCINLTLCLPHPYLNLSFLRPFINQITWPNSCNSSCKITYRFRKISSLNFFLNQKKFSLIV